MAVASANTAGAAQDPEFLYVRAGAGKGATAQKGQEPAGDEFSLRDLSRGTGYPSVHFVTHEESVMRITAWIVRGLGAGLLAYMVIPGKRSRASS